SHADPEERKSAFTEMTIRKVLKNHPVLNHRKQVTVRHFVGKKDESYVLFGFDDQGVVFPDLAIPCSNEFEKYFLGALSAQEAKAAEKLAYYFLFLNHPERSVADDAYVVFCQATQAEVHTAAKSFDPDQLIGWLRDKRSVDWQRGLFGYLLGNCGRKEDV